MLHICFMVQLLCIITPFYVYFLQIWRMKWISLLSLLRVPDLHMSWSDFTKMREDSGIYMMSSNGNIFRVTGSLCGEFTGDRWIPLTKASTTQSFDVFFDLRLTKRLSKQSWCWWFETPSRSLWSHCNDMSVAPAMATSGLFKGVNPRLNRHQTILHTFSQLFLNLTLSGVPHLYRQLPNGQYLSDLCKMCNLKANLWKMWTGDHRILTYIFKWERLNTAGHSHTVSIGLWVASLYND